MRIELQYQGLKAKEQQDSHVVKKVSGTTSEQFFNLSV